VITTPDTDNTSTDNFSIEDLNGETFSLDDLATSPLYNIKTSDLSNKQLAINTALLKEDPSAVGKAFSDINDEMSTEGTQVVQKQIAGEAKAESLKNVQDPLVNILLDPEATDEQKVNASRYALDKTSEMFSVRKELMTKQLSKPINSGNQEVDRVRESFAAQIDYVNDQLEWKQNLLNQQVAAVDNNMAGATVEFFEAMIPFSRQKLISGIISDLKDKLGENSGLESGRISSFLALGDSFESVQDMIKSVPLEERPKITQMLADIIDDNSEIIIPDENGYAKVDLLRTFLEEGYYGESEKWIDNVIGLLDIALLGGVAKQASKGFRGTRDARSLDDIIADLKTKRTFYGGSPTSAGRNAENANPDTARIMFDASMTDDKVAKSFYGANSDEVAARAMNPEPMVRGATTEARPSAMGRNQEVELSGDPDMLEYSKTDGKIYYAQSELKAMRSQVFNDFESVNGLTLRENITQVGRDDSDNLAIRAIYGPNADAGWSNVEDAVKQTMFGLRKYGIKPEDVEVLVRSGDEYVAISPDSNLPTTADYVVAVNYKYEYNPLDVANFETSDVNLNLFDRHIGQITVGQNINLTRMIKDPSSLFDTKISKGALRSEDRSAAIEKRLVELSKEFDAVYLKLPKTSQASVHEYVKEANHKGIKFNRTYLQGRGFNTKEIDALQEWKNYWDTMYVLENSDMTRKLSAQGWQLWDNGASTLIARPMARGQVGKSRQFYDSATDSLVRYSDEDLAQLYENGGTISELRTAVEIDGKFVEQMIVPQSTESYTRRIRESDHILSYRHGYYTVKYDSPWFIDKEILDDAGNVTRTETVATAGSQAESKQFVERASAQAENARFITRADRNSTRTIEDDYINVAINNGRTPQRFRGKRLRDSSGTTDVNEKYVKDPVEVMIEAARNIANRVGYRDYLETTKRRFTETYRSVLPKQYGRYTFPSNINDINYVDIADKRMYQDARQTWEYINYLENAYINGIDEIFKSTLRGLAETVGTRSAVGEKSLMWASKQNPVAFSKNIAFQALLATNPLRQFVVQGHQMIMLSALAPEYATTRLVRDTSALLLYKLGHKEIAAKYFGNIGKLTDEGAKNLSGKMLGISRKEMDTLVKAFDDSGLTANVDRHALIQGALTQMADSWSVGSKAKRVTSKILSAPRKVGFDAGENINMMTAWLTMRDRAIKAGKDFSRSDVQAEVAALARDFTYGMNFAGDMPYNQNSMSLIMQFMQAPHKAMLQVTSNRNLTGAEKARIAAFSLMQFTLPPAVMYTAFAPILAMIENEELKEAIVFGLESYILNASLTAVTGEKTRIDFSGLAPLDMYGMYETLTELWTGGIGEGFANTASMGLMFGHNPRMRDAIMGAARFFNLAEDETESPEDFLKVAEGFMSVSSGYSNYMKWSYANEVGKKMSSTGKLSNVNKAESIAILFGFPTQEETKKYIFDKLRYGKSEDFKDDFNKWYSENKRIAAKLGIANNDVEFESRMINSALVHFQQFPQRFNEMLLQKLEQDAQDGDTVFYESARRLMGISTADEFKNMIQASPLDEETKSNLLQEMELADKINREGYN